MSEPRPCPRCGAALEKEGEPCPRCLLELGRSTPEPDASGSGAAAPRPRKRASPSVEEIGKRFPELEIAARIGEGGMGAVYKARQPRIDRWVALKVLALDPVDDPTFAERFRREALVLARLDHPNVVKLYDFGERDGLFYLVLEYVDGTNLRTLMKQSLLSPAQALAIVPQMCEALQFAHDEGVVHRDIKPENVLVDAKGRVKIADFGLAKLVDADARDVSLTEVGQVMGTPHYMAPEQLRGSREVDHRADIYSLGVVFYEMLTGELPRGNFELPSRRVEVDVRLDEIVLKSLERAPERRYQHAVDVKTDVESVGAGRMETPSVAGIAIHVRKSRSGKRRVVVHPSKPWEFFVAFLLVWPLVGLAFNGGAVWFTLAMAFVATTLWSQIEHSILARPELTAALAAEPRRARVLRHVAALSLLATGLFALFAGHVAAFGSVSSGYRAPAITKDALPHVDPDAVAALEAKLEPDVSRSVPKLRLEGSWFLDHEDLWTSDFLLVLAPILLAGAAWALTWKRSSSHRIGEWMPTFTAVGTLLGPLLLLETATLVAGSADVRSGRLVPMLDASTHREVGTEELSRSLRIALVERDYAVTGEGRWTLDDPRDRSDVHELQVLTAEPASPFDRWRISWSGPRREKPRAVFRILGPRRGGPVLLESDLGDAPAESPLRHSALDRLLEK